MSAEDKSGLPTAFCEGQILELAFSISYGELSMVVVDFSYPNDPTPEKRGKYKLDFSDIQDLHITYGTECGGLADLSDGGIHELEPGSNGLRRFTVNWDGDCIMQFSCFQFSCERLDKLVRL
jgi:hypothetical protein